MIAPAANAVAKPDLAVGSTRDFYRLMDTLKEVHWVSRGEPYELTWEVKVRNIGNAAARSSLAELEIKRNGRWRPLAVQDVPRIPSGEARTAKRSFPKTFSRSNWLCGKYPLRICADGFHQVAESNEGNSADSYRPPPSTSFPGHSMGPYRETTAPRAGAGRST